MPESLELIDERADMNDILKQYSNGNKSKFVRDLIWSFHQNQLQNQNVHKIEIQQNIFSNSMFFLLGMALLMFAVSNLIKIPIVTMISGFFLLFSGGFLVVIVLANKHKLRKALKEVNS